MTNLLYVALGLAVFGLLVGLTHLLGRGRQE
jgi:hypothetical protein